MDLMLIPIRILIWFLYGSYMDPHMDPIWILYGSIHYFLDINLPPNRRKEAKPKIAGAETLNAHFQHGPRARMSPEASRESPEVCAKYGFCLFGPGPKEPGGLRGSPDALRGPSRSLRDLAWILNGSYMDPYMDPIWIPILYGSFLWIPIWILYGSYMDPPMDTM